MKYIEHLLKGLQDKKKKDGEGRCRRRKNKEWSRNVQNNYLRVFRRRKRTMEKEDKEHSFKSV